MPASTKVQSSFLGGEWSAMAQGRADLPAYQIALNVCLNMIPARTGALVQRSGLETLGPTYLRTAAKFLRFESEAVTPYLMEFTDTALRLWYGTGPVCTNDRQVIAASSSTAGVLSLTTTTNHGWAVGDHIVIFCPAAIAATDRAAVIGRHLKILTQNGTTGLTAADDLGTALPLDIAADGLNTATAIRILRFPTPITAEMLQGMRAVQIETECIILSAAAPQVVTVTVDHAGDTDPTITFAAADFIDGPYLDPQGTPENPETGTVSGYSGAITFTPAISTFSAADVTAERHIRLHSQPAAWDSTTTYSYGDTVTHNGSYWKSILKAGGTYTNLNQVPGAAPVQTSDISIVFWALSPEEGQWAWGKITAQATTSCTVTLETELNSANGATIDTWQLGAFTVGQYPTRGLYHKGRLLLSGAIPNRIDASQPNNIYSFSPTDAFGNIADDHAMSLVFNADSVNPVYWMKGDPKGVLIGTAGPEFLLHTSNLNDPLTPLSADLDEVSNYQSEDVEPVRAGVALVFVQRYGRSILEYLPEAYTGLYIGNYLNEFATHLTEAGVKELAYQRETTPILWTLMNDGSLAGCTYRRKSRFITEAPEFQGWHRHTIGNDELTTINSMCVTATIDGLSDRLYVNTVDENGEYWVETLRPLFEDV